MNTIKLYTEEQVNELCRALRDIIQWDENMEDDWGDAGYRAMDALKSFNSIIPIELPSDKEIDKAILPYMDGWARLGFIEGAKWMRDKIQ